jgi:uncharacterized protein (DUF934 family)
MQNNSEANKQIIKDNEVIADTWITVTENDSDIPEGKVIVSLERWQQQQDIQDRKDIGILIKNDTDLSAVAQEITKQPLIAIDFPVFMDGRGFSLARLLRERYKFEGEIRAVGHVIRDQLCYLKRCGFNAFSFTDESVNLKDALASLNDFTEAYQTSVDKPEPLFRRRA